MEQFYDIERAMVDSDSKYKITTGNFNAKIGTKTKEEDFKSMGAFGTGERNESGDRLIEFAEEHNLIITNILFQKQKKTKKKPKTKKTKKNNKQTKQNKKTNKQTNKQTNKTTTTKKQKRKTKPDTGLGSHLIGKQETKQILH